MKTMQEQAFHLVTDGLTTVEEVLRSVYAPGVEERDEPKALPAAKLALPTGDGVLDNPDEGDRESSSDLSSELREMPPAQGPRLVHNIDEAAGAVGAEATA
jgi:hypothetical protein